MVVGRTVTKILRNLLEFKWISKTYTLKHISCFRTLVRQVSYIFDSKLSWNLYHLQLQIESQSILVQGHSHVVKVRVFDRRRDTDFVGRLLVNLVPVLAARIAWLLAVHRKHFRNSETERNRFGDSVTWWPENRNSAFRRTFFAR